MDCIQDEEQFIRKDSIVDSNLLDAHENKIFIRRVKEEARVYGHDIWDVRLEGYVDAVEERRRKANSKMVEEAYEHNTKKAKQKLTCFSGNNSEVVLEESISYVKKIKEEARCYGHDIWDERLEGYVDAQEKSRREANSRMVKEAASNEIIVEDGDSKEELVLLKKHLGDEEYKNKVDQGYLLLSDLLAIKITDYDLLRKVSINHVGLKINFNDDGKKIEAAIQLSDQSFTDNVELAIRILKFFRGHSKYLLDFINSVNLALSNKKIIKFKDLQHSLLYGGYGSQRNNLIAYFFNDVVVGTGEFRKSYYRIDNNFRGGALYAITGYDHALSYFISRCIVVGLGDRCAQKVFDKVVGKLEKERVSSDNSNDNLWGFISSDKFDPRKKTIRQIIVYMKKSKNPMLSFHRYDVEEKIAAQLLEDDLFPMFEVESGDGFIDYVINKSRKKLEKKILSQSVTVSHEYNEDMDVENVNARCEEFKGTGLEYEAYMHARIERETPFDVELTKSSGDHGADLVIRKIGYSAVVQLKLYSTPVGNKAVQEAYTAKQHYHVGHAFVVTNSSYTRAAYEVAETTGVMLFQDEDFIKYLKSDFFY